MEIIWSPRSIEKIQQIGDFIAKDSPERAQRFISRLVKSTEKLRKFPLAGQVASENPAFRQVVEQGYRIIYRVQEKTVEIVTVIAAKEDYRKAIKRA